MLAANSCNASGDRARSGPRPVCQRREERPIALPDLADGRRTVLAEHQRYHAPVFGALAPLDQAGAHQLVHQPAHGRRGQAELAGQHMGRGAGMGAQLKKDAQLRQRQA